MKQQRKWRLLRLYFGAGALGVILACAVFLGVCIGAAWVIF